MSRIGLKPIEIPAGVDVKVDGTTVTVKGPKGELTRNVHPNMAVAVEGNEVIVKRPNDEKENKSLHGLTRTLIHNMVLGVTEGFKKNLEVNGVGYRVQVHSSSILTFSSPLISEGWLVMTKFSQYNNDELMVHKAIPIKIIVGMSACLKNAFIPNHHYLSEIIIYMRFKSIL